MQSSPLTMETSLQQTETTPENHNQPKCRDVEPLPSSYTCNTTPTPKVQGTMCKSGGETVGARESGSLLVLGRSQATPRQSHQHLPELNKGNKRPAESGWHTGGRPGGLSRELQAAKKWREWEKSYTSSLCKTTWSALKTHQWPYTDWAGSI